jgi:outer membrane autotransporter protein
MTKNKFLSKRLACFLTTSLITLSSIQSPLSADEIEIDADNVSVTTNGLPLTTDAYIFLDDAVGELRIGDGTGDPAQTINAQITNETPLQGTLRVLNDETIVTFNATTFDILENITLSTGSVVVFNTAVGASDVNIVGSAQVFFSEDSNVATIITTGNTSQVFLGRNITNGEMAFFSEEQNIEAGTKVFMPVTMTGGNSIVLFYGDIRTALGTAADSLANTRAALEDTSLFTYTAANNGLATAQTITATARTSADVASTLGINNNKALAFIQAHTAALANEDNDDGAITAFEDLFTQAFDTTKAEDTKLAKQSSPQTDTIAGSAVAAKAVTSGVQNIMSTRLASLRSGDAYSTGVVTGSGMSANSGFIQAFGSTVEQKNKGDEFGYDADTTGFALGFDGKVSDGVVLGISYANSKTDVDGKGTGKAKNDIKTNSGSIYADYTTKDGYVEGSITYGKSDNKGSRIINTAGLDRTYASNYDSEQYSFRLSGGIPQSLGGGAFFTPFAAATISQIKADAYTETSTTANDTLRLRVAQDTVDSQVGTIGIKYHQAIKDGKTTFTPEVKLAVNQEFGDDTITSTNTYQGGGASFKNSTAIEKTSATAGVGLNISSDNVSFNIGYEADVRDDYLGHSAQAKITAKF